MLTGSRFKGTSQASGGNFQDSSTNYPIVQLRDIDNSQVAFLPVDPTAGWSDTTFTSTPVNNFPAGPALVTVFTNGIPSDSKYIVIAASAPIVAFAALYVIWGSTYLGIKFSIETIPPFLMAGARFVLAGMIMYAIAWSQGIGKSTWANWRTSFVIGACLLLGGNGGVTISEQYIDSGLAALIVAIVPIYIVLLGWATGMAPRPTPIMWMGLAGGFVEFRFCCRTSYCRAAQSADAILRSAYRSSLSQVLFGRRVRFTRVLRDTRPHHFSPLLNK